MQTKTKVLIVVAHPDDEVLSCGATGATLAASGHEVRACILSAEVAARSRRPADSDLRDDIHRAQERLGFASPILGKFPNIALNTVPHLDLVKFIEGAISDTGASILFTHHPRDLNNDHCQVSLACQAASRLARRRDTAPPLTDLLLAETLSSTDWSVPDGRRPFDPNTFFPVTEEMLTRKAEALACYRGVVRQRPHSRNEEIVRSQAALRGAQCGALWAEAFESVIRVIGPSRF